jgi:hypothetical protein
MCKTSSLPEQFSYTTLHTVNKPSKFILREILPFFYPCCSQFSKVLTLRVTMVKSDQCSPTHALWGACAVTWQAMELYLSPLVACIDSQSSLYVVWRCHPCRADDLPVDDCQMRSNDISQYGIAIHLSVHSAIENIKVQLASERKAIPHSYIARTECTCWKDVVSL